MATYTRPAKTVAGDGTTAYVDGNKLPAAELNADFDNLITVINGQLDSDNISSSANIPNSALVEIDGTKVADHAEDDATFLTATSAGDSFNTSRPTNLEGELERLRYRIKANNGYFTEQKATNASNALTTLGWTEPPIAGPNLLLNAGFEDNAITDQDPPTHWTEEGTLTASSIEGAVAAHDTYGGHKRSLRFTGAASAGISQTVQGLKAETKYLFGAAFFLTTGGLTLRTAGGLAASNAYQDPSETYTTTGSSVVVRNFVVQTDSSATDIKVELLGSTSSNDINILGCWFHELNESAPAQLPHIPTQTKSTSTEVTNIPATVASGTDWNTQWTDVSTLSLSQYIPSPGYRLIYDAQIAWGTPESPDAQIYFYGFRLDMDDGSGSVVDGPVIISADEASNEVTASGTVTLTHIIDNPTPGVTYAFTPQVTAADPASGTGSAPRLHPAIVVTYGGTPSAGSNSTIQTTSRARLRVEKI